MYPNFVNPTSQRPEAASYRVVRGQCVSRSSVTGDNQCSICYRRKPVLHLWPEATSYRRRWCTFLALAHFHGSIWWLIYLMSLYWMRPKPLAGAHRITALLLVFLFTRRLSIHSARLAPPPSQFTWIAFGSWSPLTPSAVTDVTLSRPTRLDLPQPWLQSSWGGGLVPLLLWWRRQDRLQRTAGSGLRQMHHRQAAVIYRPPCGHSNECHGSEIPIRTVCGAGQLWWRNMMGAGGIFCACLSDAEPVVAAHRHIYTHSDIIIGSLLQHPNVTSAFWKTTSTGLRIG